MKHTLSVPLATLLAGCHLTVATFDYAADSGPIAADGGADSGLDGGPVDGGSAMDADTDAGPGDDAGGGCTTDSMCASPAPYCDLGACVACTMNAHCLDADPCTVDRCSLGECTHVPADDCAGHLRLGGTHACAQRGSRASCWGRNSFGQLGDSTTMNRTTPTRIGGLTNIAELAAGGSHTCARLMTGSVRCWGSNPYGQLGDDSRDQSTSPAPVVMLADAQSLGLGGNHSCSVRSDGTVSCWGRNSAGQVGDGSAPDDALRPAGVVGIDDAVAVAGGSAHTCAVRDSGAVSCWGSNSMGQLGNGTTSSSEPTPVDVMGVADATQISAGALHTCALRATGGVVCWGANNFGQLGDGSMAPSSAPAAVPGITDAISVEAGDLHTCALRTTGDLLCWGQNADGQLGDSSTTNSGTPVPVPLVDVIEVACGSNFTCARRAVGPDTLEVLCWGSNLSGQLGDGTTDDSPIPTAVVGL